MGTYTANYQLYMPSIGEQGWGDLMNGNLTTIDTTMKSLSNSVTSLDSRLDTVETYGSRITAIENEVNGALSCTSVTTSGNVTVNGNLTVKGGISGGVFNTTLTNASNVLGGLYISSTKSLTSVYVSGNNGKDQNHTSTVTYTYRANPICNSVTFQVYAGTEGSTSTMRSYVQVNGTIIVDTGTAGSSAVSKTITVNLNNNDTVVAYSGGYKKGSFYINGKVDVVSTGFIVNV